MNLYYLYRRIREAKSFNLVLDITLVKYRFIYFNDKSNFFFKIVHLTFVIIKYIKNKKRNLRVEKAVEIIKSSSNKKILSSLQYILLIIKI